MLSASSSFGYSLLRKILPLSSPFLTLKETFVAPQILPFSSPLLTSLPLIKKIILSQIPALLQFQILQQRRFNIQLNVITLTQAEWNHVRA